MILIAELLKVKYMYWMKIKCKIHLYMYLYANLYKIFLLEEYDFTRHWKSNLQLRDHLY